MDNRLFEQKIGVKIGQNKGFLRDLSTNIRSFQKQAKVIHKKWGLCTQGYLYKAAKGVHKNERTQGVAARFSGRFENG